LLITGFAFFIPGETSTARVAVVALGMYLFAMAYSPGEGPVPFTYSAEVFPLYVREVGMSFATAVCWGFNFVLSLTFPLLLRAFKPQGAFGWYAAWCFILWRAYFSCSGVVHLLMNPNSVLILMFVPETKGITLEELDEVFSVPTTRHAAYGLRQVPYAFRRYVLHKDVKPEKIYSFDLEEAVHRKKDAGFNVGG
jgi:hypothetical protein